MSEVSELHQPALEAEEKALPDTCAHTVEAAKDAAHATSTTLSPEELQRLTDDMVAALKTVYDPEIPVNIFDLGLIYDLDIGKEGTIQVEMSLTAPGCPVAGEMPSWVENAVRSVDGVQDVKVNLTFDPPWDPSRMSEEAQIALNMF